MYLEFQVPKKFYINKIVYVADEVLGYGSEGIVLRGYKEQDPNKNQLAIKVSDNMNNDELKFLHKHLLNRDHDNIIKYFEIAIKTPDFPYFVFVMELGSGNLFDKIIQRRFKLDLNEVLEISLQIAKGIQSIHNLGFMHRDIKPENIILVKDQWKICDFGRSRHKLSSNLTKQIGTAYYVAPETIFSDKEESEKIEFYDQKIDVWGLGCIIYEIYTQNLFFNGNNFDDVRQELETYTTKNEENQTPEDKKFENLPEPLKRIIQRMLVVKSSMRITIQDVIQDIQELLSIHKQIEIQNQIAPNQSQTLIQPKQCNQINFQTLKCQLSQSGQTLQQGQFAQVTNKLPQNDFNQQNFQVPQMPTPSLALNQQKNFQIKYGGQLIPQGAQGIRQNQLSQTSNSFSQKLNQSQTNQYLNQQNFGNRQK